MWKAREPDRFVVGVNLPWIGYGTDVGASLWFPNGGLSRQPAALDRLDRTLAAIAHDGISVVRVFLLCDARSGVRFDSDEFPVGVDEAVLPDINALLAAARRHHVGLIPVLLDFICAAHRGSSTVCSSEGARGSSSIVAQERRSSNGFSGRL